MKKDIEFDPFPIFQGPHQQTVFGAFLFVPKSPDSVTRIIPVDEKNAITIETTTPAIWKISDPTVVLVHGLCGSHESPSVIRIAKVLLSRGIKVVRLNLRNCGSAKNLSKTIFHGGQSNDVLEALKVVKQDSLESPIVLMGFSMGGNIILKLAGELGSKASKYFDMLIALNPPVDLYASAVIMERFSRKVYLGYFMYLLRTSILELRKNFPELPEIVIPYSANVMDYDRLYTVPTFGFKDIADYYKKCSCIHYLPDIKIPTKILVADDDPVICSERLIDAPVSNSTDVYRAKKGGHLGYLGHPNRKRGFYWLDNLVLEWFDQV
jgi:uncharacterized protein